MATEGGGKMKNKRHKDPESPYGRKRSLIGQVTETVKGVIGGSWLTNLVNSVRKTPPKENESREAKEDVSNMGNYPKSHSQGGSFIMTPGREVPPNVDPMNYSPAQVPYTPYMQMTQHVMVNGGDRRNEYPATPGFSPVMNADSSEYQSNMLHLNDSRLQQLRREFQQGVPHSTLVADQSPLVHPGKLNLGETTVAADEGSFLWSTKPRRQPEAQPQVPSKVTKASFNASVFGTTIGDKSVVSGTFGGQSPFYPGRTMFGGAASHRKPQATTAPYQLPSRKLVASKPLQPSSAGGVSSSTAKKILETLEKMSTPLADARKIPTHDPNTSLLITPVRKRTIDKSRLKEGPPTQQITPLGFASIAPNKSISNRRTIGASVPGSKVVERTSLPSTYVPSQNPVNLTASNPSTFPASKSSGKMKRDKGSHHYSSKAVDEDEHVEAPDLPTNFTLPLSGNLPTFSFASSKAANTDPTSVKSDSNGFGKSDVAPSSKGSDNFIFSSPIAKATPTSSFLSTTPNNFEFSSPIKIQRLSSETKGNGLFSSNVGGVIPTPIFGSGSLVMKTGDPSTVKRKPFEVSNSIEESSGFKPAKELKQGSVMDILGKSSSSGLQPATELKKGSVMDVLAKSPGGIQPASELKTGSVMDILKNSPGLTNVEMKSSNQSSANGFQNLFGKPATATQSDSALNKSSTEKSDPKASKSSPSLNAAPFSSTSGFEDLFSKPANTWKCSTCLVQNKLDASKCAACETPKPSAKPAPSMPAVQINSAAASTSGFGTLFSKPTGSWECSACMVQNKPDVNKCAACETPKPGAKQTVPLPTPLTTSQPAASGGFGNLFSKPTGSWECSTCMVQNKTDAVKCAACETPKPGAKPSATMPVVPASSGWSGFALKTTESKSWECNTCLVMNKPDASKCIACETPKPGAKPTTGFTSPGGFKFGASGGLKLPTATTQSSSASNFGSGAPFKPSTAAPVAGGFKLPTATDSKVENKEASTPSAVVKFGSTSSETVKPLSGGFSLTNATSDKKEEKNENKPAAFDGFKLGNMSSSNPTTSISENIAPKTVDKPVFSGFQNSEKTDSSPALGGFKYNAESFKTVSDTPAAPSVGGFKFSAASASIASGGANSDPKSVTSLGGAAPSALFSFSKTDSVTTSDSKVGLNTPAMPSSSLFSGNISQTAIPKTDSSSAFTPSAQISSPFASSGFQFGNTANSDKGGFSFTAPTGKSSESLGKRTRDELDGPSAKKQTSEVKFGEMASATAAASTTPSLFSFSASSNKSDTPTAGPFGSTSLGGTGITQSSSTPFSSTGFGSTSTNLFGNVGSQPKESTPAGGLFGAAAAAPAPSSGTAGFQFGNTASSNSGLFQFGANNNKPQTNITANSAPLGSSNGSSPFVFGQASSDGLTAPAFNVTGASFNFGAPTTGTIQFGAGGNPASNASNSFSMGRAPAQNPLARRTIKKAARKLKK